VGPRAGLDDVEKRKFLTLPGLELRPLGCPARSQSLYRLRYPGKSQNYFKYLPKHSLKSKQFSKNQRISEVSEILQNIKALIKLGKSGKLQKATT
jgi:hypothetical protein